MAEEKAGKAPTKEEKKEEDRKIRHLRRLVDLTIMLIFEGDMTLEEASRHVAGVREFALKLFPGKGEVFDIVYGTKLRKALASRYRLS